LLQGLPFAVLSEALFGLRRADGAHDRKPTSLWQTQVPQRFTGGGESFGRYHAPSDAKHPLKTSIKPDIKLGLKPERAPLWRVIAAGAPISANEYHCAIVGAEEATAVTDRINAAHWRAARAGERGYRLSNDLPKLEVRTTPRVSAARPILPDDLSIPAFLDRRPLPRQELSQAA
jgi:hypothetical protein